MSSVQGTSSVCRYIVFGQYFRRICGCILWQVSADCQDVESDIIWTDSNVYDYLLEIAFVPSSISLVLWLESSQKNTTYGKMGQYSGSDPFPLCIFCEVCLRQSLIIMMMFLVWYIQNVITHILVFDSNILKHMLSFKSNWQGTLSFH